jgi:hypothetical protein
MLVAAELDALHPCIRVFPLLFDPPLPPRVLVLHVGAGQGPTDFV